MRRRARGEVDDEGLRWRDEPPEHDLRVEVLRAKGGFSRRSVPPWRGREQFLFDVARARSAADFAGCAEQLCAARFDEWSPELQLACPCCIRRRVRDGLSVDALLNTVRVAVREYAVKAELEEPGLAAAVWAELARADCGASGQGFCSLTRSCGCLEPWSKDHSGCPARRRARPARIPTSGSRSASFRSASSPSASTPSASSPSASSPSASHAHVHGHGHDHSHVDGHGDVRGQGQGRSMSQSRSPSKGSSSGGSSSSSRSRSSSSSSSSSNDKSPHMSRVQFVEALAQVLGLQMSWFSANALCEALAGGKSAITLAAFEEYLVGRAAETTTQPEWRKLMRWLAQFIELSDVDVREALAHFDPQQCGWISAARLSARAQQMGRPLSRKLAQAIMQAYGSRGVEDRLSPEQFAHLLVDCVLQRARELEGKEGLRAEAKRARCEAFLRSAYQWDPHETQPEWRELLHWLALFVEHSGADAQQAFDHFDHRGCGAIAASHICAGLARHMKRPLDRKLARAILQAYGSTEVEDTIAPEQFTNLLVDAVLYRVRSLDAGAHGHSAQARLARCHAFLQSAYVWTENTFAMRTRAPRVPVNMDRAQLRALRHVGARHDNHDDVHWRDDADSSADGSADGDDGDDGDEDEDRR